MIRWPKIWCFLGVSRRIWVGRRSPGPTEIHRPFNKEFATSGELMRHECDMNVTGDTMALWKNPV